MKYYEIKANVRTFFEKDEEKARELYKDKEALMEASKGSADYFDKNTRKGVCSGYEYKFNNKRDIDKRWRDFVMKINSDLLSEEDDEYTLIAKKMTLRDVYFLVKTDDDGVDRYIKNIKNRITKLIYDNKDIFLINSNENGSNQRRGFMNKPRMTSNRISMPTSTQDNEASEPIEKEYYIDTNIDYQEISFRDFFFVGMDEAQDFGLDIANYFDHIDSKVAWGNRFHCYDRIDRYYIEKPIEKKLSKKEFSTKYKDLLLNKSFKAEIDRIYKSKNDYNVSLNPVHYELCDYNEEEREERALALATALYSNNRISVPRFYEIKVDVINSYIDPDVLYTILNNSQGCFVFLNFEVDHNRNNWSRDVYYGRTSIRTEELTDNIINLKDDVQFAFYVDKYQDKVRDTMYDELNVLNIVTFDEKIAPEKAIDYVKELAEKENVEVSDKLINMVKMSQDDMTLKDAKDIFDNYKDEIVKTKYFPEYKEYFDGKGNVDNYIDPYEELMAMPGLSNVKKIVNDILTFHKIDSFKKEHFMECKSKDGIIANRYNGNSLSSMNMIFMGNPGTCKTTVAKMIAKILKSRGIIKNDRTEIYGVDGRCNYLENAFKYAYGGVLFIDEAYNLGPITDLVALMENHRKDVIVILAGYTGAMKNFLHLNQGLKSRFKYLVEFEDYTEDELWEILKHQAKEQNLTLASGVKDIVMPIFSSAQCDKEMGNGRLVRNMLEMAIMNQADRFKDVKLDSNNFDISSLSELTSSDFDIDPKRLTGHDMPKIIGNADPEIELNNMIGLSNIKSMIKKCIGSAYMNKVRKDQLGKTRKDYVSTPMHLAFLGNPGTAKTTVARLVARILKKKGVIKKDAILEVGRADLIGQYVGETAPKVKSVFSRAKGGVLFIDEAYSLVDDRRGSFGDEAINTIIAEMENHRDDVIVIFAGYTDRMQEFIERNEGLRSRLSYILEFEDYTAEELIKIFDKMVSDSELIATAEAKEYVKTIIDDVAKGKDYGNGRFVRKLLENAKLNMDYRLSSLNKDSYTFEELKTLIVDDFKDLEDDKVLNKKEANLIGFAA